jgi:hypothetical protein
VLELSAAEAPVEAPPDILERIVLDLFLYAREATVDTARFRLSVVADEARLETVGAPDEVGSMLPFDPLLMQLSRGDLALSSAWRYLGDVGGRLEIHVGAAGTRVAAIVPLARDRKRMALASRA